MPAPIVSERVSADQLKLLKSLIATLQEENFVRAKQILETKDIRRLTVQLPALQESYIKTLLELNEYDLLTKEIELSGKGAGSEGSLKDATYIRYRLEEYDHVLSSLAAAEKSGTVGSNKLINRHLKAQSLYHLGCSSGAAELYRELAGDVADSDELKAQLLSNMLATRASNAVPFCESEDESSEAIPNSLLEKEIDLALNHAILRATMNRDLMPLRRVLTRAKSDASANDTVDRATLALQSAHDFWRGSVSQLTLQKSSGSRLSDVLQSIQQYNAALSLLNFSLPQKALEQLPPMHAKWSPLQTRIAIYNKACLQLHAKNYDECRATLKENAPWFEAAAARKTKQKPVRQDDLTQVQALWWQARVNVLLYCCDVAEEAGLTTSDSTSTGDDGTNMKPKASNKNSKKSLQQLETTLQSLKTLEPSSVRDHAILYTILHMGEAVTTESVPDSLHSKAGLQYVLNTAPKTGDWYMSKGDYIAAVRCYEHEAKETPSSVNKAKLVRALSFVDPQRATELWKDIKNNTAIQDDCLESVNGAELEQQELPRLSLTKSRNLFSIAMPQDSLGATQSQKDLATGSTKKTHEAILRRRSRRKQEYLDKLTTKGLYRPDRPVAPDPERWLPKYERSYYRKRRGHHQRHEISNAHQGGVVSDRQAQKLDVVARQQISNRGNESGTGKSTAHLAVVGGNGKSRGGRKK